MPNFSETQISEWRDHPVTSEVLALLAEIHKAQGASLARRYLSGSKPEDLESERLHYRALQQILDDLSGMTAEDIEAWKDQISEWQRNKAL